VFWSSNFRGAIRKRMFCTIECIMAVQGSSKVIDFGANRKRVCNFLLDINSNLGPFVLFQRHCRFSDENSDPAGIPPEF